MMELLIAGAVVVGALAIFWDKIRNWLNTVAADAVERALGYGARQKMQKAVCTVSRLFDTVHIHAKIFTTPTSFLGSARVVNVELESPTSEVGQTVVSQIDKEGVLVKEMQF